MDGLLAGEVIGLPPVLNFGTPEVQAKVIPEVLAGKKFICLAITGTIPSTQYHLLHGADRMLYRGIRWK